jgi:hypothetical protein
LNQKKLETLSSAAAAFFEVPEAAKRGLLQKPYSFHSFNTKQKQQLNTSSSAADCLRPLKQQTVDCPRSRRSLVHHLQQLV